jgi:hypothetical protein
MVRVVEPLQHLQAWQHLALQGALYVCHTYHSMVVDRIPAETAQMSYSRPWAVLRCGLHVLCISACSTVCPIAFVEQHMTHVEGMNVAAAADTVAWRCC